jgi:TM2 domain-containing membrane protein YozV
VSENNPVPPDGSGNTPPPSGSPVPPPAGYPAAAVAPAPPTFANGKPSVDEFGEPVSDKSRLACTLLAFFLGVLGIHRFYVGKIGTGILMIITAGGLGIWVLIDLIMIVVGSFRDKAGRKVYNW